MFELRRLDKLLQLVNIASSISSNIPVCQIQIYRLLIIRLHLLIHQRSFLHSFQTLDRQWESLPREASFHIFFHHGSKILYSFSEHVTLAFDDFVEILQRVLVADEPTFLRFSRSSFGSGFRRFFIFIVDFFAFALFGTLRRAGLVFGFLRRGGCILPFLPVLEELVNVDTACQPKLLLRTYYPSSSRNPSFAF